MSRIFIVVVGLVALILLVILAVVAGQVGGITIRSASRTHDFGTLTVAGGAVLPGVPAVVTVANEAISKAENFLLTARLLNSTQPVREVTLSELATGRFSVVLPCDLAAEDGEAAELSLVLLAGADKEVVAQSGQIQLLPPGPDCAF